MAIFTLFQGFKVSIIENLGGGRVKVRPTNAAPIDNREFELYVSQLWADGGLAEIEDSLKALAWVNTWDTVRGVSRCYFNSGATDEPLFILALPADFSQEYRAAVQTFGIHSKPSPKLGSLLFTRAAGKPEQHELWLVTLSGLKAYHARRQQIRRDEAEFEVERMAAKRRGYARFNEFLNNP